MQISASYTRDLKRTYRVTARLRRRSFLLLRALGVPLVLLAALGAWSGAFSPGTTTYYAILGVVLGALPDGALWLNLLRNRDVYAVDVTVDVSDRGITSRTATQTTSIEWGNVSRILHAGDCWIFVVNRLQVITLYQNALTPLQQGQLAAFLDTRM